MATKDTNETTAKAVEATKGSADTQAVATVQTGGRVTDEGGVQAVVNPEAGATSVAFPTGDGGLDVYEAGKTHTVPKELLEVKDAEGNALLVKKEDDSDN